MHEVHSREDMGLLTEAAEDMYGAVGAEQAAAERSTPNVGAAWLERSNATYHLIQQTLNLGIRQPFIRQEPALRGNVFMLDLR